MFPVTPRAWAATAAAVLRLPAVFGDNMVLQQGQPVPIWGWADKGEEVTVSVAGQTRTANAGEDGRWKIVLDKLDVGQPLTISIKGSSGNAITLKNVLVGEVWVCSGQSNMELRVVDCKDAQREIAAADYPKIRLFNVVKKPAARRRPTVWAIGKNAVRPRCPIFRRRPTILAANCTGTWACPSG